MQIYKTHKKQTVTRRVQRANFTVNYGCPGAYRYFLLLHVTDMITLLTGLDAGVRCPTFIQDTAFSVSEHWPQANGVNCTLWHQGPDFQTRCSAIAETPRCRVRYSFPQK